MEYVLVWIYGLKFPITILCVVGIVGCFLSFLSSRAQGRGGDNFGVVLSIGIGLSIVWALIYAMPPVDYNKVEKVVYKTKVVEKPVVKKVISYTKTITKFKHPKRDERVEYCREHYSNSMGLNSCTDWAIRMELPQQVQVKKIIVKPKFQEVFEKCNNFAIPDVPNGAQIRNERIKRCGAIALAASKLP